MSYIHAAFVLPFHLSCKLLHIDQYTWENNSKIKENGAFSIHNTSVPFRIFTSDSSNFKQI